MEMDGKKLKIIFLISGIIIYSSLTLIIWPDRFYYDDEWINLRIITKYTFSGIISLTSHFDFHPPLQYILNKIFYQLFGPEEWLMSIPSIISTGLASGLTGIILYNLTGSKSFSFLTILVVSIHPSIQMWGWSIRWYPAWSFFSIASFYFALRLWREKKFSFFNSAVLAFFLIIALYTNYQTLAVIFCLIISAFFTDLNKKNFGGNFYHTNTWRTIVICLIVILFFLPWIGAFNSHLSSYFFQKNLMKNFINPEPLIQAAVLFFNALFGSSIYPWDILFILLFATALFFAFLSAVLFLLCKKYKTGATAKLNQEFFSVAIFSITMSLVFCLLDILSGSLPNRGDFIISFTAVIVSVYFLFFLVKAKRSSSKKELYAKRFLAAAIISLILINCYGTFNLAKKEHFHKMGLSDPIAEIVNLLEKKAKENSSHKLIFTINPVLTYYLLWKGELINTEVISPYIDDGPVFINNCRYKNSFVKQFSGEEQSTLFFVESYMGSLISLKEEYKLAANYIKDNGSEAEAPVYLGEDKDLYFKKKIFPRAQLQKFRFKISFLKSASGWDIDKINKMIKDFSPSY
ncbi:MAG: hypothetical protein ACM34O_01950 [Ignavibacteria bacterium]